MHIWQIIPRASRLITSPAPFAGLQRIFGFHKDDALLGRNFVANKKILKKITEGRRRWLQQITKQIILKSAFFLTDGACKGKKIVIKEICDKSKKTKAEAAAV